MKIYFIIMAGLLLSACGMNDKPSEKKSRSSNDSAWQVRKDLMPERISGIEMDKNIIIFDDGDTITYKGIVIRVLGIDTPEIIHEEHRICKDQKFGRKAAKFTKNELLEANTIYYFPYKKDIYGRMLSHVVVDGELLAVKLIKAGLAYETISYYGGNGFLEFEQEILEAWKKVQKPHFENPVLWRRKYQDDFK